MVSSVTGTDDSGSAVVPRAQASFTGVTAGAPPALEDSAAPKPSARVAASSRPHRRSASPKSVQPSTSATFVASSCGHARARQRRALLRGGQALGQQAQQRSGQRRLGQQLLPQAHREGHQLRAQVALENALELRPRVSATFSASAKASPCQPQLLRQAHPVA